jgi:hypothetical protein
MEDTTMTPDMTPLIVELYEQADFGGQMLVMVTSDPDLRSYGFTNKVNSIRVLKGPHKEADRKVRLHRDAHFQGGYVEVRPGEEIANLQNTNHLDNVLSIEFI